MLLLSPKALDSLAAPLNRFDRCTARPGIAIALIAGAIFSGTHSPLFAADLVSLPAFGVRLASGFQISLYAGPELANDIQAMTLDARGNVVVTGPGYISTLLDTDGDGVADTAVRYAQTEKGGMGLCFDGVDLYYSGDGGLFRFRDLNQDGVADGPPERIFGLGAGEHGGHAVRKGPDGWLYVIGGNDTGFGAEHMTTTFPPVRNIEGGALVRFSLERGVIEPVATGFRNPYDFDFNAFGEIFTYDSDVESDYFLPWYTPTRLYHIGYGGHHGWRLNGYRRSWNRPDYYLDTVDILAELGRGSPTGLACYRHYRFPQRYRNGLFALDWTFGRVYFAPLVPNGSTYQSAPELFMEPLGSQGLAPTGVAVTPDGALLVSIGGRRTRGAVYRIDYPAAGSPWLSASNWLITATSESEAVLNVPQPLDAWSRAFWEPTAVRLGPAPFVEAAMDGRRNPVARIRAIEILTQLHGGLPADMASLAAQANSPLVRARVAWALGRAPKPNSGPLLVALSRDIDSGVRRSALEAIGELAPGISVQLIQQALAANLAHPDKRIRQDAARLTLYLPDPAWRGLWTQWERGSAQGRLTLALALAWRSSGNALNVPVIETALSILGQTRDHALRLDAVRLIILGLGDWRLNDPGVEAFTGYEPAVQPPPDLLARIRRAAEPLLPSGDSSLDTETSRLLAMVEDENSAVAAKVVGFLTEKSSPTADFHYLAVLARLKAPPPTNSSTRVAHAILALDRKLNGLEKRPKQNWTGRLAEVVQVLLARDPKLAPAIISAPEFTRPAHVPLASILGSAYFTACAQRFLDAVEKNSGFTWSAQLIDLLSALPNERVDPLLRRQWPNLGLRDEIILKLSQHPALADRDKFVTGLSSPQVEVVRASMSALLKLPRDESARVLVPLLRFLRRMLNEPDQQIARAQAVALLNFQTGEKFKIQEPSGAAVDLSQVYQPIFTWCAQKQPVLLRQLDADDAEDPGKWNMVLRSIPTTKGDPQRGEVLFRERACQACHASATPVGPDLGGVADRLSVNDLFKSIIFPSRDVAAPYRTTTFRTRDGQNYTGIVVFESADGVIVQTGIETTVRLSEAEILSRQPSNVSLMPSGLLNGLKPQNLADLYSYLATLRPATR